MDNNMNSYMNNTMLCDNCSSERRMRFVKRTTDTTGWPIEWAAAQIDECDHYPGGNSYQHHEISRVNVPPTRK